MKLNALHVHTHHNKTRAISSSYYDLVNIVPPHTNIIMVKWFYYNEHIKGSMPFHKMAFLFFKTETILIYMTNNITECTWILQN